MLQRILKVGTELSKKEQRHITGGGWPTNEADCIACGGYWSAPLCELPYNSPCA